MNRLITLLILIVGLINLYPVVGIISPQQVLVLYGIDAVSGDVMLLLRHRAVLFGLLGVLIVCAAFWRPLRATAYIGGLVSMLAFIALAAAADGYGDAIFRIAVIDAAAVVALLVAVILDRREAGSPP